MSWSGCPDRRSTTVVPIPHRQTVLSGSCGDCLNRLYGEVALQQTLVIVKPDGVQRGLVGKILARFEERGFKIVALNFCRSIARWPKSTMPFTKGKFFYQGLFDYITSSPVAVMVLEGHEAIGAVRAMVGATRPWEAAAVHDPGRLCDDGIAQSHSRFRLA